MRAGHRPERQADCGSYELGEFGRFLPLYFADLRTRLPRRASPVMLFKTNPLSVVHCRQSVAMASAESDCRFGMGGRFARGSGTYRPHEFGSGPAVALYAQEHQEMPLLLNWEIAYRQLSIPATKQLNSPMRSGTFHD